MIKYDLVSREKYGSMRSFYFQAFCLRILGSVKNSVIGLTFLYAGVIFVISLPDPIAKFVGGFAGLVLTFMNLVTLKIVYNSKVVFEGDDVFVQFGRWKFYKTKLANIELVYRTNRFNGSYRVVYRRNSFGRGFFNIFADTLPTELKAFLSEEDEVI